MTLRLWLFFFIISMAVSAEVLAWAILHGQFRKLNRGNVMPLRDRPASIAPQRHTQRLIAVMTGIAIAILVWSNGIATLVHQAFSR
jgi:hypothetical protein